MNKKIAQLVTLCLMVAVGVQAQIQTPMPSSAGSVSSVVGLTEVKIDYFRPKKKGRNIFGTGDEFLEQYGKIWRTGANSGSKITFSTDVKLSGKDVAAGEYLILTVPGKDSWDFILYSDISLGGNVSGFKEENEVVRVSVAPEALSAPVETLTFQISDISEDSKTANIHFAWDNVAIKVPLAVDFDAMVMKSIAANTQVNPGNYTAAANYYLDTNRDLEQALEWMNLYLAIDGNETQFWHIHTKARILAAMGNKKEAKATAKQSMDLAKKSTRGDFGYIKRNEDLIKSL